MHIRLPTLCLLLASLAGPLPAQSGAPAAGPRACDLLSTGEVQKVTGRTSRKPPSPLVEAQNKWSQCSYRDMAVWTGLFATASTGRGHVEQEIVVGGLDQARHAVAGVGDSAAIYYRAKGKDGRGLLVTYAGARALIVRVDMDPGQPSEAARPYAIALAKIALAKLK